jgi:hypothetical protein
MKKDEKKAAGRLPKRIVTSEDIVVVVDEYFAFTVGSLCVDRHSDAVSMSEEWTANGVGVYVPPRWGSDIIALVLVAKNEENPNRSCAVDMFSLFHLTRVRTMPLPQDIILRVMAIATYLGKFESEFNVRDAEYLALAEALGCEIWTTSKPFKERMDNITRQAVFEEYLNPYGTSNEPSLTRIGDRSGYSYTKVDVRQLATRVVYLN